MYASGLNITPPAGGRVITDSSMNFREGPFLLKRVSNGNVCIRLPKLNRCTFYLNVFLTSACTETYRSSRDYNGIQNRLPRVGAFRFIAMSYITYQKFHSQKVLQWIIHQASSVTKTLRHHGSPCNDTHPVVRCCFAIISISFQPITTFTPTVTLIPHQLIWQLSNNCLLPVLLLLYIV